MSELSMARRIAERVLAEAPAPAGAPPRVGEAPDAVKSELEKIYGYLTAYIPTGVVTAFIPVWSALVASELGSSGTPGTPVDTWVKLVVAIVTGLLAGGVTWGLAQRRATQMATARGAVAPSIGSTLRSGIFEVLASIVAAFTWATVAPRSWAGITEGWITLAIPTAVGALLFVLALIRGDE